MHLMESHILQVKRTAGSGSSWAAVVFMQRGSPSNSTAKLQSEHPGCYASIAGEELCLQHWLACCCLHGSAMSTSNAQTPDGACVMADTAQVMADCRPSKERVPKCGAIRVQCSVCRLQAWHKLLSSSFPQKHSPAFQKTASFLLWLLLSLQA